MSAILVLDCETTGLDASAGHAVVEVAVVPVVLDDAAGSWRVGRGASSLVAPGRRVPPEACAVHHLVDADLRSAPKLADALRFVVVESLAKAAVHASDVVAVAAHNAPFDASFLGAYVDACLLDKNKRSWLCTYRLAQHLWPEAPGYANQVLRYWLNPVYRRSLADLARLPPGEAAPHRALYDAVVTAHLLVEELEKFGDQRSESESLVEALEEFQARPILQRAVRFGQHRGAPWSGVPRSYLRWVADPARRPPFDRDVLYTANHYLRS